METLGINHYDDKKQWKELSGEEKNIERLIREVFYKSDEIKHQGQFSIITNGFYKSEDFEDEFTTWKKTEDYEYYLDVFKVWYMNDDESKCIFDSTYKAMFEEKNITDPYILLSLVDRIVNDIKRGVVDLDFEMTKNNIKNLFTELYEQGKMDYEKHIEPPRFNKYEYCKNIYSEVVELNRKYNENHEKIDPSKFWLKLKESPDKLDDLMNKYKDCEIFSLYDAPEEIVKVIESLNNGLLFEFTRWMGSRINDYSLEAVETEHGRAQAIVEILEEKYKNQFSVKAGHIKQIARVLKNRRTDYDPEYINKNSDSQDDLG